MAENSPATRFDSGRSQWMKREIASASVNDPTETIAALYAAFDVADADDALILGLLADAYGDAGWHGHEAATREILAAGLRPGPFGWRLFPRHDSRCATANALRLPAEGWLDATMRRRISDKPPVTPDHWYYATGPRSAHFRRLIVALAPTAVEAATNLYEPLEWPEAI